MEDRIWKAKLLAYLHDPATKAIILMQGIGHEEGSVKHLKGLLFNKMELEKLSHLVKKADQWAAAADRPDLPEKIKTGIRFLKDPELIHPLTGKPFALDSLAIYKDLRPDQIESLNFSHFNSLIVRNRDEIDYHRTFLSFWRFGPESPSKALGLLWQVLPADTRSPDHSIWEHLSLTSGLAGAMAEEGSLGPALLLVSFGPVQSFISQARSVSDLWAGSHLLSTISWQGIKVICKRYGPDSIIFPNLLGVPIVDVWLRSEERVPWPSDIHFPTGVSDSNPLFGAALPNRFVAIVPDSRVEELVEEISKTVRGWVKDQAYSTLKELQAENSDFAKKQVERQFEGFPEINWAVVPWSLAGSERRIEDEPLKDCLEQLGGNPGYLGRGLDQILRNEIRLGNVTFYNPNPGIAYPGLYELLERLHIAAKLARPFKGDREEGYRCSICGEREWISNSKESLLLPPGRRKDTLWQNLRKRGATFMKEGEHLCGWCGLKRFWPRLFVNWVGEQCKNIGQDPESLPRRYVVSTHTFSLSTSIWNWKKGKRGDGWQGAKAELRRRFAAADQVVALPEKLYHALKENQEDLEFFKKLPAYLDLVNESNEDLESTYNLLEDLFGERPETYYGLILMDGDRMGKWLSGDMETTCIKDRFHRRIREELSGYHELKEYLEAKRPTSPSWHQAISTHLNNFAIHIARPLVEEIFMGKLIYAGGDDLLAMVAVHDLVPLMIALRCAYSGELLGGPEKERLWAFLSGGSRVCDFFMEFKDGYALITDGQGQPRLFRLMGGSATASTGAVIAHHKTPLGRVLSKLREAEKRAKQEAGRDAFCITLMKRAGGEIRFLGRWQLKEKGIHQSQIGCLLRLRNLLGQKELSRRTTYAIVDNLKNLPPDSKLLYAFIRHQFVEHGVEVQEAESLAGDLVACALDSTGSGGKPESRTHDHLSSSISWLIDIFVVADFLSRNTRFPLSWRNRNGLENSRTS